MKPRLIVVFALIVFAPLVILGWLGVRFARSESEVLRERFHTIVQAQLADISADIDEVLARREREFVSLPSLGDMPIDELRRMTRRSPIVTQFFVLDDKGELLFPRAGDGLSAKEADFLQRTKDIWVRGDLLLGANGAEGVPADAQSGWYSWYWGSGVNVIFWWRDGSGKIAGAELNRARLTADIIAALPDSPGSAGKAGAESGYGLLGSSGERIYLWGARPFSADDRSAVTLNLSPPLSSWHLAYYHDVDAARAGFRRGLLIDVSAGLAVLFIVILALALYFYREQTRDLREASQRVSFVNQVSHELKTPLTNIRMYAEILEEELDEADSKQRKHLGVIVSESQRLSRLIGNVLTFSRQQRNALTLHPSRGVIDESLRATLENFSPALEKLGIEVRFDGKAGQEMSFDRDAVEQILGNLLSNVEKYAQGAGALSVASEQDGDTVTVTVADNGPGIPARERERIFEPFHRVSNKLTDGVAGTGIGLSIARDLAHRHGGTLTLEASESGARFKLVIRALQPATGTAS